MSDLIDRQKAYEVISDYYHHTTDVQHEALREALNRVPSAEPERKAGKWLWKLADNGWADHVCSVCGWTKNTDIHVSLGYKYCPNCGAYNETHALYRKERE